LKVPLGLGANGMPLGIQIVSDEGQDGLTIAVAEALQAAGIARSAPPVHTAFL